MKTTVTEEITETSPKENNLALIFLVGYFM